MRYIEEYHMGYDAGSGELPATDNPHVWHSVAWWAWHAGWVAGAKDAHHDREVETNRILDSTKPRWKP